MLDPVPPPAPWLSAAAQPLADKLGLHVLPAHVHEMLFAFILYQSVEWFIAPAVSSYLFPKTYPNLSPKAKINWNVKCVSLVQSTLINIIALWVINVDTERKEMNALERVYGYTGACGLIGALGLGYFLWDLIVSLIHFRLFGIGILLHAMSALCVFSAGFRPYLQYYGSTFILYELSSPFLNIHWFCDKLNLTGSRLQWYNGIMLLATFAGSRLFWGTYQSIRVYQDIWAALHIPANTTVADAINQAVHPASISRQILVPKNGQCTLGDVTCAAAQAQVGAYVKHASHLSWTLALSTLASNLVLNSLNFYWYGKMIRTVKSRFDGTPDPNMDKEDLIVEGVVLDTSRILENLAAEGKGKITEDGFTMESEKNQSEEVAKAIASAVEEKTGATNRKKG